MESVVQEVTACHAYSFLTNDEFERFVLKDHISAWIVSCRLCLRRHDWYTRLPGDPEDVWQHPDFGFCRDSCVSKVNARFGPRRDWLKLMVCLSAGAAGAVGTAAPTFLQQLLHPEETRMRSIGKDVAGYMHVPRRYLSLYGAIVARML
jgi:hypothetical protein